MNNKYPISIVIIAFNEEKNIEDCLISSQWAMETIVVDSGSTDRTIELSNKYTDKIFFNSWEGFAKQKRFALAKASFPIILSLDADERVSPELKDEIINLLNTGISEIDGYFIPRRNFFLGKWIKTCFWYPDYQLRLFKKEKVRITEKKVHEGFVVEGQTDKLSGDIIHYTHNTLTETFDKINKYSSLNAEERINEKNITSFHIIFHPISAFLNHFISRKGYKDGIHGLMVSVIHAVTNMMTYMKIWELQNKNK